MKKPINLNGNVEKINNITNFIPTRSVDIENNTPFDIYCVVTKTEIDKKAEFIFHIYEKKDFESRFPDNIIPDEIKNFPSFSLKKSKKEITNTT